MFPLEQEKHADHDRLGLPKPSWFFNAYMQIAFSIVLSAASQVFMKLGARTEIHLKWPGWSHLTSAWLMDALHEACRFCGSILSSDWVWLGILALIASLVSWLHALRFVPLNVAFMLAASTHALIPLSCWLFLGETISGKRWLGIALVIAGVFAVARPLVRVEEKL